MQSFHELIRIYSHQHQHKHNKILHKIGIPLIIFSVFMLLNWVNLDFGTVWRVSFAWLSLILVAAYYFKFNIHKLAAVTTVLMIVLLTAAAAIAGPFPTAFSGIFFLATFVVGWGMLFVGHGLEKSKPAFMQSLIQVMSAPLFLTYELFLMFGIKLVDMPSEQHSE